MEEYELAESIGFGSFSTVYKSKKRNGNENFVAIKIAKIEKEHESDDDVDRILVYNRKRIEREVELWKSLDHDSLCRLLDNFIDEKEGKIAFVMEYAKDGDLLTILSEKSLEKGKIKGIFRQLCGAVEYLHVCGVVHGDIKLENILLNGDEIKLSDFGLSRRASKDLNFNCGTVEYAAPELLQNESIDDPFKADIWSLGVVLYALLYRRFPFDGPTAKVLKIRILTSEPNFEKIEGKEELIELVKQLLNKNPMHRPSIKDIIELL